MKQYRQSKVAMSPPSGKCVLVSLVQPRRTKVVPGASGSSHRPVSTRKRRHAPPNPSATAKELSFRQTYGKLGFPIMLAAVISLLWTVWVVFMVLAPNEVANFLMQSWNWDDGRFWLIPDNNSPVRTAGVIGLVTVATGYVYVILKMTRWRSNQPPLLPAVTSSLERIINTTLLKASFGKCVITRVSEGWRDVTGYRGVYRKHWNMYLKVFDLFMQSLMVRDMLIEAAPLTILYGFTTFLAFNSAFYAVSLLWTSHSALTEIIIDSVFDLFSAVIFPICVLVYACSNFDFDRGSYQVYLDMLPPGSFERRARMVADPSEIALFRSSFDALQFRTWIDVFVRIGINITFCYRFKRVLEELARSQGLTIKSTELVVTQYRPVPRSIAILFLAFSGIVVYYTYGAVASSTAVCNAYPQCIAFTYRWHQLEELCPCQILIDVDREPKTFDEWLNPIDATLTVRSLARSGHLRNLQLINRRMLQIPEELQICESLQQLFLMYSGTLSIPSWIQDFRYLEYFQIDGKLGERNLLNIPSDLFKNMPSLLYLQIGIHLELKEIPPLEGVPNLRTLVLVRLFSLQQMPSFTHVKKLERIELGYVPVLQSVPDMAPLQNLVSLSVHRPTQLCCNGFRGVCNLTDPFCQRVPFINVSAAKCLDPHSPQLATKATLANFEKFSAGVCQPNTPDYAADFPSRDLSDICGGVLYRKCVGKNNATGMCYNGRMQVLSCTTEANKINMRKLQIARRVGRPCDPVVEQWLGCQ